MRSSPSPVSTEGLGSGSSLYLPGSTSTRLYCMKTRFQISIVVSPGSIDQIDAIEVGIFRMLAEVIVDFRVWTARTGLSHLPEIILAPEAQNPLRSCAHLFPERSCFVVRRNFFVAAKDSEPQSFGIELEFIDEKIPGKLDRVLLK